MVSWEHVWIVGRAARRALTVRGLVMATDREAALTAAALNVDIVAELMRQLRESGLKRQQSRELFQPSVGAR